MTKRIESQITKIRRTSEASRFNLGILALMLLGILLIIIATFSQLSFYHYYIPFDAIFSGGNIVHIKHCEYIPQIPVLMFVATLLGPLYAFLAVLIYILLGLLAVPIFALGGGIMYFKQYGFGYILAYLPAAIIVCRTAGKKFSYLNILKASFLSVFFIHLIGILYVIFTATIKRESYNFILDWIYAQSIAKFIYDFVFSFIAIVIAKFTRKTIWLIAG